MPPDTHRADERRFLDERGSGGPLAPNGLNPATIMEKAVRERIVDSYFWKEQCFGVNEADIVDRVVSHVSFIGGTYGDAQRPSPFLCLAFKLLQLSPPDDVLEAYLGSGGEKFKYLRALACFYVRLTRRPERVHTLLEPFLEDGRKLRRRGRTATTLTYIDEFVDDLLNKDRVCATSLWQMPKRETLEDLELLEPRVSPLGDIEDLLAEDEDEDESEGREEDDGDSRERRRGVNGARRGDDEDNDDEEEGEIDDDRSRRSRSSSSSSSARYRRRDRDRSSSRRRRSSRSNDRMDVDQGGRPDGSRSPRRSRSGSKDRSQSRRTDSR